MKYLPLKICGVLALGASLAAGCQTAKSNQSLTDPGQAAVEQKAEPAGSDEHAPLAVPETFSVEIRVSPAAISVGGEPVVELDDGWLRLGSFEEDNTQYHLEGLVAPVEEARKVARRQRQAAGKEKLPEHALIELEPGVTADVVLAIVETLATTDLRAVTLRTADGSAHAFRLTGDHIGARKGRWISRKRASRRRAEKARRDASAKKSETSKEVAKTEAPEKPDWLEEKTSAEPTYVWVGFDASVITLFPANKDGERLDKYRLPTHGQTRDWWRLYNAMVHIRRNYPTARTLLVWPAPWVLTDMVASVSNTACKLPKDSYDSAQAYEEARSEMDGCEPLFPDRALGNGDIPAPNEDAGDSEVDEESSDSETPDPETPETLAARVPSGQRAFFLEFETGGDYYRQIEPGARVDVLGILDARRAPEPAAALLGPTTTPESLEAASGPVPFTVKMLDNVPVLGTYPHPDTGKRGAVVAVAAAPREQLLHALTRHTGELHLVLRRDDDFEASLPEAHRIRELLERLEVTGKVREKRLKDSDDSSEPAAEGPLVERIPKETRAVFIDVPVPAGAVTPGDRLDLLGTFPLDDQSRVSETTEEKQITLPLVQAAKVLDVVEPAQRTADGSRTSAAGVVVALSLEEAQLILLSRHIAQLDVSLRGSGDIRIRSIRRGRLDILLMDLALLNKQRERIIYKQYRKQIREQSRDDEGIIIIQGN